MMKSKQVVNEDTIRQAIFGASILNGEMLAEYEGKVPQECLTAIEAIEQNKETFQSLIWKRLASLPLTKKYFGKLIRARLKQQRILLSPILSTIFNDYQTLEQRLERVQIISGIEKLKNEYRGSNSPLQGEITDSAMRNMLAEIIVFDFLIKLGFVNIRKISHKDKAHIDIIAEKDSKIYAIDSTRKKEVKDWEIQDETNLEDCQNRENQTKIQSLIIQTLGDKNEQFGRSLTQGTTLQNAIKMVAIKTSDYGFSECIDQIARSAKKLLSQKDRWHNIDGIWLIPTVDISQSRWILK